MYGFTITSGLPLREYLINKMDNNYMKKIHPKAKNGRIVLNNKPGFGIEWEESKIEKRTES